MPLPPATVIKAMCGMTLKRRDRIVEDNNNHQQFDLENLPVLKVKTFELGYLFGEVRNHPKFSDGHVITTSVVLAIDFARGLARTKNTLYKIEFPAPVDDRVLH